jgi:4-amino-4-deoxy-L-arabinose transferase-like glycosyltransferase
MKINWQKLVNPFIVFLLALVFFIATSSFNYFTQDENYTKWTSPDETANYFFSKRLSETGELAYFDQAAILGDNLVMPRSLRSDFGWVKPVSFLGIILTYGSLSSLFGVDIIPFLTPFFAALGIIIFYLFVSRIFKNSRLGLLSAFLLATFPVYIYYTVRSMFHNVLFVVALLIGVYLFSLALGTAKRVINELADQGELETKFFSFKFDRRRIAQLVCAFFSGLFIGLAIITRTSELLWLLPVFFIIWLFYARRLGLIKLILFLSGIFLTFLPIVYWNTVLYENYFRGGYNEMNRSLAELSLASGEVVKLTFQGQIAKYSDYFETVAHNVFYFGFNPTQSIEMFRHYVLEMFPALVYLGAFGLLLLIIQNIKHFQKKYLVYILAWGVLSVILVFYYGSWRFNDNPDPTRFTIGNSYTRYWLPIYILLLPLVALAIERTTRALLLISNKTAGRIRKILAAGLQALAVLGIAFTGLMFVLFGSEEGLAYLYHTNLAERKNAEEVFALTDPTGIIITQYYDKFFFPERRIIMGRLPNDEILTAAEKLLEYYPVYYYNFYLDDKDVQYLNDRKFAPYNLEMKLIKKTNAKFGLYQLNLKTDDKDKTKINADIN